MPVDRSNAGTARDRVRQARQEARRAVAADIAVVQLAADAAASDAADAQAAADAAQATADAAAPKGGITASSLTIATDRLAGRDSASTGAIEEIAVGGGIEFTGSGALQTSALTGDVVKSAGGTALTMSSNAATNTVIRDSAALSVIGRSANSTGDPADIAAGTDAHVLRRSGTTLGFGTLAAGAYTNNTIDLARLVEINPNRILGNATGSAGVVEEIRGATLTLETPTAGSVFPFWNESNELRGALGSDLGIP